MSGHPLSTSATLYDVVRAIEQSRRRIAVVVDDDGRLLGTLTDGDVRRCILAGGSMQSRATDAMNSAPLTAQTGSPDGYVLDLMKRRNVLAVPLVDAGGRFVRVVHLSDLDSKAQGSEASRFAAAVIMAGGEGTRLRSVANGIPKPMVEIDGIPLLERQVKRLASAGVERCFVAVNYLGHVIEGHFGNGSGFGIRIDYLHEKERMGTAGALSLLPALPDSPVLVMNGDVLTTSDLGSLYTYHESYDAAVTVAAVEYWVRIPYGVVRANGPYLASLEEKPSQRFLCNAGIYAIAPEILRLVPERCYNMTDLLNDCLKADRRVSVFPVHEYWSDIGTPDDLEKARAAFARMESRHE